MFERCLWAVAGITSTLVGFLGLIIPIIPGILFLLLAAVCFSRALNPRARAQRHRFGSAAPSFADELRADMHQQYRRAARELSRQQRRLKRR